MCFFLLWTKHLVTVYRYLISVGIVFLSFWSNVSTIEALVTIIDSKPHGGSLITDILNLQFSHILSNGQGLLLLKNYLFQSLLAYVFCYIHLGVRHPLLQKMLALSFILPSLVGLYPIKVRILALNK